MEILNTIIFYILIIICTLCAVFCLFQKNTVSSVTSAILLFWGLSGFYFLLGAPYLGSVQILLWGAGMGALMLLSVMTVSENNKKSVSFSLKSLVTPFLSVIFALLIIPFLLYQFKGFKTAQTYNMVDFAINLYKNNAFGFELTGVLLFAVIIGAAAVITIKNARKQVSNEDKTEAKKGENV